MNPFLSEKTRIEFKKAHKKEPHRRHADRIKAILLLDSGWSYEEVAEALLLDDQTIRNYEKLYKDKGFDGLLSDNYVGCMPNSLQEQEEQLKDHIRKTTIARQKKLLNM
ncbi:MAG: helix-turn-helix domain-containing protein [Planctomycetia bacterium]|nr:helix-turn-helix domain-containing protein [Planctomycetia bacterium]